MSDHVAAQKSHYEKQYANGKQALEYRDEDDLWEWAKWYPLLDIEGFLKTLEGKSIVATCCGAGKELGIFNRCGLRTTATDLSTSHLSGLVESGVIDRAQDQNAERLTYDDESFDYGFVNAGLHHLERPHAGLNELMRVGRQAAIFIESQDSFLHSVGKLMGRNADFEPAGNYVYRWNFREIEKIAMSSHAYGFAVKTSFLPVLMRMRGVTGAEKKKWQQRLAMLDRVLNGVGNLLIAIIFKRQPTEKQIEWFGKNNYRYTNLVPRYPDYIQLRK